MSLSRRRLFESTAGLGAAALAMHPLLASAQNAGTTAKPASDSLPRYRASTEDHPIPIINLDLIEQQAKEKFSDFAYAFVSGAAGDEWTLMSHHRNRIRHQERYAATSAVRSRVHSGDIDPSGDEGAETGPELGGLTRRPKTVAG
jgi:hypothetical protein